MDIIQELWVPVALGIGALLKYMGASSRAIPVCVVTVCIIGQLVNADTVTVNTIAQGILRGLVVIGFYSGTKNTLQKRRRL